jgi:hypothetical protein
MQPVNGILSIADAIQTDLRAKVPHLDLRIIRNISYLVGCVINAKSVNTSWWKDVFPTQTRPKIRERRISRLLSNPNIKISNIMTPYVQELIKLITKNGETLVLMMDQSQISPDRQCLMVSMAFQNRAMPILWCVVDSKGALGFDVQESLLNIVKTMIPEKTKVFFLGDRFYGTSALVNWCQNAKWSYMLRTKGNYIFTHDGGEIDAEYVGELPDQMAIGAVFNNTNVQTNIGYMREDGYDDPWIVVTDVVPTQAKINDYSMRWGIECLFSDLKSRGFDLESTHLRKENRIENLILILTISLYWCVSVGLEQIPEKQTDKKARRSKLSTFQIGLRTINRMITFCSFTCELWKCLQF